MSMHPEIIKLTNDLFLTIASFFKSREDAGQEKVPLIELIHYLQSQHIHGLTFRNTYPYSYQVEYIVTNLVRKGRIEEDGQYLSLSLYGKELLEKATL